MFDKLNEIEKRYQKIEEMLSDPKIISNQQEFQKLMKERAGILNLVGSYRKYRTIKNQINDTKELLNEGDEEIRTMAKAELDNLTQQIEQIECELKVFLLPTDPNDEKNIILEIRAGTGGDEAALFAGDLYRMYTMYAETKRWKIEALTSSPTGLGGFKEIISMISGEKVYSNLKYESGVHRVQRVPQTETSGRIHTSAVTVAVLPEAEDLDVKLEEKDIRVDVYRSSGPGGQSVNTTDSAVRVTHIPTNLVVTCQDEKSQHKNKAKALKILKARLKDKMEQEQADERAATRKGMVGSGDRSERIRTYNFPQGRLTDHRINLTLYRLESILEGQLDEVIDSLRTHFQTEALKGN